MSAIQQTTIFQSEDIDWTDAICGHESWITYWISSIRGQVIDHDLCPVLMNNSLLLKCLIQLVREQWVILPLSIWFWIVSRPVQKGRAWQQQEPKLYSSRAPACRLLLYPLSCLGISQWSSQSGELVAQRIVFQSLCLKCLLWKALLLTLSYHRSSGFPQAAIDCCLHLSPSSYSKLLV